MRPMVIKPGGKIVQVKNLGWLLRHWKKVERFEVIKTGDFPREGTLKAFMADGSTYVTDWASLDHLKDWINRPVFRGVPICWKGIESTVGA